MGIRSIIGDKIAYYSRRTLLDGFFGHGKKVIRMHSTHTTSSTTNIPLTCFSRTQDGNIILYRGIKIPSGCEDSIQCEKSVAASFGETIKSIFASFGKKDSPKTRISIANDFSGLTQGNDPILHTTTKRNIAKNFTRGSGLLIKYSIPPEFLSKRGIVAHLGENEIDFFYSLPKKYISQVTTIKSKVVSPKDIPTDALPQPPMSIDITF